MRGITKSEDMKMKINKQNMTFREGSSCKKGGGKYNVENSELLIMLEN